MLKVDIEEIFIRELAIYYSAKPSPKSIVKLNKIISEILEKDFTENDVIGYVEFVYRIARKVRDSSRRASVDYFVAILSNDNSWQKYMDLLDAKQEVQTETGTDSEEPTPSVSEIRWKGQTYIRLGSTYSGMVDIYYNPDQYRFVVCNCEALIVQYVRLSKWNKINPTKKITEKILEPLLKREGFI